MWQALDVEIKRACDLSQISENTSLISELVWRASVSCHNWCHYQKIRVYEVCPEGFHPRNMKNRNIYWRRYKMEETLYIRQWRLSLLQSRHLGTSLSSPNCYQLPCRIILNLIESEISFFSKVILVSGTARSCREPNLGCRGAESPGWFDVSPKNSAWDMIMKLPITSCHSCSLLNHLNSFCRGMF